MSRYTFQKQVQATPVIVSLLMWWGSPSYRVFAMLLCAPPQPGPPATLLFVSVAAGSPAHPPIGGPARLKDARHPSPNCPARHPEF